MHSDTPKVERERDEKSKSPHRSKKIELYDLLKSSEESQDHREASSVENVVSYLSCATSLNAD
jgi:hypothetical protein